MRWLKFTIRDEGIGIADVDEARQPLYTTKPELRTIRNGLYHYGKFYG